MSQASGLGRSPVEETFNEKVTEKLPASSKEAPGLAEGKVETASQLPVLESQTAEGGVPIQTPAMKRKALWQFATLCLSIYVSGWNDGTIGPLLPRLQEVYNVRAPLVHRVSRSDACLIMVLLWF